MSMISAQIDELRELAGDGSMEWVTGPIRASVLRDAADTIWELRDDLQRANVENGKLRELVRDYEHCSMHADCDRCEYDGTTSTHCPLSPCFPDIDELNELGVEVDE